jgi:G:T/U-mismatch repair DNA glycosylase
MNIYRGFEPFFDGESRVLILGSFPSVKSRESGFYYGNKQNRFFKMLSKLFGEEIKDDVNSKKDFLKRRKIALWDVVSECEIDGSSDSKISRYSTADICYIFGSFCGEKNALSATETPTENSTTNYIFNKTKADEKTNENSQKNFILDKTKIEKILLNGKKAYEIFKENYPEIPCILMPSTSPANPSYNYEKWANELSFLKE